jgi:hypothetical protein
MNDNSVNERRWDRSNQRLSLMSDPGAEVFGSQHAQRGRARCPDDATLTHPYQVAKTELWLSRVELRTGRSCGGADDRYPIFARLDPPDSLVSSRFHFDNVLWHDSCRASNRGTHNRGVGFTAFVVTTAFAGLGSPSGPGLAVADCRAADRPPGHLCAMRSRRAPRIPDSVVQSGSRVATGLDQSDGSRVTDIASTLASISFGPGGAHYTSSGVLPAPT